MQRIINSAWCIIIALCFTILYVATFLVWVAIG